MRFSLALTVTLLALGATRVGADPGLTDVSTWRWQVSAIQNQQKMAVDQEVTTIGITRSLSAPASYEGYSPQGAGEADVIKR